MTAGSHRLTARAYDRSGNLGETSLTVSTNMAAAPDTQPPVIHIQVPIAWTVVRSATTFALTATDNVRVLRVDFIVDNVMKSMQTAAPYSWRLDPTTLYDGPHTLTVIAYDAAGNIARNYVNFSTSTATTVPGLSPTRHYSHI